MNDPDTYRKQLDTVFQVEYGSGPVPLRLTEVADERTGGSVQQFSLFFHGPGDRILPQGTYSMQHDVLGALALFIVPVVGSNAERIIYQACFTRVITASRGA
jgi:hypothetical protein